MTQANNLSIFMLPRLKDNQVKHGAVGMWNRQDPKAFNAVALSIEVIVSTAVANVNSIPSMWAHPLSLESILPSNEYHDRIRKPLINQWRGMLAAIALAPDFEEFGKLTAQPLDLTDARYRNNKFIQSLFRLVPSTENCLFDLPRNFNPWLKGYIFRWNNKSIGMTSPSTIVCPSEDGDWTGLPWFIEGEVESPEEYLTSDQKLRLSRWLVHLRRKLAENPMGLCGAMSSLLNSFIDDLKGDRDLGIDPATDLISEALYFGVQLDLGIYEVINQPLRNPRENVFLPELYFLRRPDAFPNAALPESVRNLSFGGSPISLILPIQPSFFNRADASSLLNTLRVDRLRAGTALKMSISVDGGNLEQEYELKNENAISGLPITDIWPNFVHPNWKIYYVHSYDLDRTQLNFDFPNLQNPQQNIHAYSLSKLSRLDSFPKHVICSYRDQAVGGMPLKVPSPVIQSKEWTVGVDFGTSFTNVYKKENEEEERLKFENLHYAITDSDETARASALTENFIPLNQVFPISTLLTVKDCRIDLRIGNGQGAEMIFDGRIYSLQASTNVRDGQGFLISDLKWNNTNIQRAQRLFVEQLVLQISAQAAKDGVSRVKWAISYPTAFSDFDKDTYFNLWNTFSGNNCAMRRLTGLTYSQVDDDPFISESLAGAHFFSSNGRSLLNAACMDVGGGTTDISIWESQNNIITPIYQCSVQLAGKHLFSHIIYRHPEFLTEIELAPQGDNTFVNLKRGRKDALFYSALDALVKETSDDWLVNIRPQMQHSEKFKGYLQILAVGIGGLHYYIGLILKALHRNDATYGQRYRSGLPVNVYFGGNGCRLLNWLSLSGQFTENQISNLFKDMVVTALESTSQIKRSTAISTSPKDEAACGLVVGQMQLGNPVDEDEYLIAGEPCIIDNHQFGWDHYIFHNAIEDIQGLQVGNAENQLENLPQFLHYFNKSIKTKNITNYIPLVKNFVISNNVSDTIRDNADLWAEVDEKLRQSLLQVRGVNKQSIRLEPPFILALKALIEVLADRWANQ